MNTKLPSLTRGDLKVEWLNLGEGVNGDYDESDPNDVNLLRFDVSHLVNGEWEPVDDASYCTQMPADTSEKILVQGLENIMGAVSAAVFAGEPVDDICARLSWMSPEYFEVSS